MSDAFMSRVIELALENARTGTGGPFAALVLKEGKIVGTGTNRVTSANDPTAHAEIVAIRDACTTLKTFQLTNCEVYSNCEPCPMCMGALYWARPARIFYAATRNDAADIGFSDAFIYDQLKLRISDRSLPMLQLMREQALEAFRYWKQKPNKILY